MYDHEHAGIILCRRPANERRRYIVTSSLIGWAHIYKMIPEHDMLISQTLFKEMSEIIAADKILYHVRENHFGNYINPGYGLSLVDTLWNAGS